MGCVDRFFDRYVSKFVFKRKLILLIIAGVWLGISFWRAMLLESVSYNEQFFLSSNPVQKAMDIM